MATKVKTEGYIVGKFNENGDLKNKHIARKKIVKHIKQSNAKLDTILTLPFIHCMIEKMIIKNVSKKVKFIGVEKNENDYHKMLSHIANNKLGSYIFPRLGEMAKYIAQAKENEYSHLILDYCGSIATLWKEIQVALVNDIVKINGIVAITINKRFQHNTFINNLLVNFPFVKGGVSNTPTEHIVRTIIDKSAGLRYKVIETFDYRDPKGDDNNGANMLLLIVKRIA